MPLRRSSFPEVARLFPTFFRSSQPAISFWPLWHALRRSGIREFNPPSFVSTGVSESSGVHSDACHSGARDFPLLHVYSRGPLGLVNLAFFLGRLAMRYVEVACMNSTLHPSFAQVPLRAVGFILTHATPARVFSRSCASIPDGLWV